MERYFHLRVSESNGMQHKPSARHHLTLWDHG